MVRQQAWMADDDEFDYIVKNSHKEDLDEAFNMKIIYMLKNLQNSVMLCLSMEHRPWRGR